MLPTHWNAISNVNMAGSENNHKSQSIATDRGFIVDNISPENSSLPVACNKQCDRKGAKGSQFNDTFLCKDLRRTLMEISSMLLTQSLTSYVTHYQSVSQPVYRDIQF